MAKKKQHTAGPLGGGRPVSFGESLSKKAVARSQSGRGGTRGWGIPAGGMPDLSGLVDSLAGLDPEGEPEYEGGGGGGYEDDGMAEYLAMLEAAKQRVGQQYEAGKGAIQTADSDLMARFTAMQAMNDKAQAATASAMAQTQAGQEQGLQAAVAPVLADLAAQGVSTSPVQQGAAVDASRLADQNQRQQQYLQQLNGISQMDSANRMSNAGLVKAGAMGELELAKFQALMDIEGEMTGAGGGGGGGRSYGGGRGGGGRGGGGYGADGYLTAGSATDVAAIGENFKDTMDVREGASQAGTGNKRMDAYLDSMLYGNKKLGMGHVTRGGGGHARQLAGRYTSEFAERFAKKNSKGGKNVTEGEQRRIDKFEKLANRQAAAVQSNRKKLKTAQEKRRQKKDKIRLQGLTD
jgi:hypothetical protein